ncbi:MAG: hypothetical protein IPP91_05435 [Betaproteobacteria bacterium]|nr:hypothetical protein [Betaproteobacteria bacterium]
MKRLALIACLAGMLSAPAFADYDAALEAREAAQRKAEQQEAARKKAEIKRQQDDRMKQYQREAVGAEGKGKSDAEVKAIYDKKMAAINKQAAEYTRASRGSAKADPTRAATGKSTSELQNMSNEDAQALAIEMQKKYGK